MEKRMALLLHWTTVLAVVLDKVSLFLCGLCSRQKVNGDDYDDQCSSSFIVSEIVCEKYAVFIRLEVARIN